MSRIIILTLVLSWGQLGYGLDDDDLLRYLPKGTKITITKDILVPAREDDFQNWTWILFYEGKRLSSGSLWPDDLCVIAVKPSSDERIFEGGKTYTIIDVAVGFNLTFDHYTTSTSLRTNSPANVALACQIKSTDETYTTFGKFKKHFGDFLRVEFTPRPMPIPY